ncbi:O-antigen ligase family protein [Solwaraspora sp. WMMB335]|uniref:O-antigen ligase family protein n=1 Tax=Solwaraspora sp. WMMB335 TaxID=3404118 RepID=UPI003B94F749
MAAVRRSTLTGSLADPASILALGAVVVSIGIGPMALLPSENPHYAGIANLNPTLHTYTIALATAFALLAVRIPRRLGQVMLPWLPLLAWLVLGAVTAWEPNLRTLSGVLHLVLGAMAFAIGQAGAQIRLVSRADPAHDPRPPVLGWAFALVAWAQLIAVGLAAIGLPLRRIDGVQALDVLGRATGLTAHPGELAKLLFFCGMCALVLPQRTRNQRRLAWSTLAAVFVGVWLTQSRTALVAVVSMVGLFLLLERANGRWQRQHLALIGLTGALGLGSLPWLIERFTADPGGGARGHVAQVAFEVIIANPWAGVGPNGYVALVGRTDSLTASGVPVHNIFLLSLAELGIVGAALLWLPLLLVLGTALRRTIRTRGADPAARLLVSATPGILLIGMTGWGLLQGPYFLMFMLIVGFFGARVGTAGGPAGPPAPPAPPPAAIWVPAADGPGSTVDVKQKPISTRKQDTISDDANQVPARRRASLAVASGLLGVAAIANRLTILVLMALLTRGAGAAVVGYYGLATLSASFVAAFLSFGLATYLTREYAAGLVSSAEVARLHFSRLTLFTLAGVAAWIVTGVVVPAEVRAAFLLCFVASLLEQWNETAWPVVRGTTRGWVEAATNGACGVLLIGLCGVEVLRTGALDFDRAGQYLLAVAVLRSAAAVLFTGLWRQTLPSLRRAEAGRGEAGRGRVGGGRIRQAAPYFAADLLGLAYFRGDTFILALFVTAAQVGVYVSAAALVGPAVQVAAAMGVGALAFAAGRRADDHPAADDPVTVYRFFRTAGWGASGLLYLALPAGIAILFGTDGSTIAAVTTVLGLFLALRFANYGLSAVLLAAGRAGGRLIVLVCSLTANVLLNLLLASRFGVFGAAWSTVLTELVVAASMLWFIRSPALLRPVLVEVAIVAAVGALLVAAWQFVGLTTAVLCVGPLLVGLAGAGLLWQRRAAGRPTHTPAEAR